MINNSRNDAALLPDFRTPSAVFLLVLVAEVLALLLTLAQWDRIGQFWVTLGLHSLFVQWVTLSSAALLSGPGRRWRQGSSPWPAVMAFAVVEAVALIYALLVIEYAPRLGYTELLAVRAPELFLVSTLGISGIAVLLMLRYLRLQQRWRSQVQAEAHARMQALQARIRPHFLFNSLNTIAQLIRRHPDQAEEAVLDLADLFRAALRDRDTLPLGEELELIRGYLRLQALRLGDRLRVDWALSETLPLTAPVPALILQPLVENAVVHGIQPSTEGGTIRIALAVDSVVGSGPRLRCEIGNPVPREGNAPGEPGTGMALDNVRQRLALLYGARAQLTLHNTPDAFRVVLVLPLTQAGSPNRLLLGRVSRR